MPKKSILKKDIDRLLVIERKKMRLAQKESKFKSRTLSIYKGQVARAEQVLPYTIEDLREYVRKYIGLICPYCFKVLTIQSFVCDHAVPISRGGEFTLDNLKVCCRSCNFQKGIMTDEEFVSFNLFIGNFTPAVSADIRARLTSGGKWRNI